MKCDFVGQLAGAIVPINAGSPSSLLSACLST